MEAAMQHHAESARRIGVNYGFLGAELNQFTRRAAGMADSLNISDEQARDGRSAASKKQEPSFVPWASRARTCWLVSQR
jgi:hypothetical protein